MSGSIDDVMYNHVKLAMSGKKGNEVIKILSQLLQEAVEVHLDLEAQCSCFGSTLRLHRSTAHLSTKDRSCNIVVKPCCILHQQCMPHLFRNHQPSCLISAFCKLDNSSESLLSLVSLG